MTIVYNIILSACIVKGSVLSLLVCCGEMEKKHKNPSGDSESPGRRSAKNTP